ncbi:cellulose biosynthesis protein BcsN [Agrobacterium sp. MA01]|uniref:cellulose biosynthesis protein BcsN n=1 Tax=Agrobacterium sp. MA01 TaxID=2664893 RepID=UPI00352A90F4
MRKRPPCVPSRRCFRAPCEPRFATKDPHHAASRDRCSVCKVRSRPSRLYRHRFLPGTRRREFPGVAMSIDPGVRQNFYGAYGTATGKLGANGGCVYAWQSISCDIELGRDKAVEVHLRDCHAATGPDRLADLLSGLSMNKACITAQSQSA